MLKSSHNMIDPTSETKVNNMTVPNVAPTPLLGMGAVPQQNGCVYRVWAPFASSVSVWGDFFHAGNLDTVSWDEVSMARDGSSGYWSVFVQNALSDSQYKFKISCDGRQPSTHQQDAYKHDPYARDAISFGGNDVVVSRDFDWTGDDFQMPGWNEIVIYEIHIGSFNKVAGTVGTFDEAVGKLDYVASLGFNAIEVMPAFDFDTVTSMGYNTALPFAMDNAYGHLAALKTFVKEAHKRGIAVILDVVYNHLGPQGLDDGLARIDGWWQDDFDGIYFYQDVRAYTPYDDDRPDFGRGDVRTYLRNHVMTCLEEFHADGLRIDSTIAIRRSIGGLGDNGDNPDGWTLLRWFGEEKRASQPWKLLIAEDLQNDAAITQDALFGGMGLDSQWDSWFLGKVRGAITAASDDARSVSDVAAAIAKSYNSAGPFQRVIYTESHDQADYKRLPDIIQPGNSDGWYARKLSTLGAAITFTSPGTPMIFMGQEFLEWQPWTDSQDVTPLDWTRVWSQSGTVSQYRRLAQLRRNWDNNTRGLRGSNTNIFWTDPAAGIIAFHRWDIGGEGDDVLVVLNLKGQSFDSYNIGFPQSGSWYLRFNSDWTGYYGDYSNFGYDTTAQVGGNQGMPFNGNIGIGPYSTIILSQ